MESLIEVLVYPHCVFDRTVLTAFPPVRVGTGAHQVPIPKSSLRPHIKATTRSYSKAIYFGTASHRLKQIMNCSRQAT